MIFYNSYLFGIILSLGVVQLPTTTGWKNAATVTATAYNSLPGQTDSTPNLAAWGDILKPGMKSIAVSRDLIPKGLSHNARVKIEGFDGTYVVLDKMNKRWKKKIDIYMGKDAKAARQWGKKKVNIKW
ncbi:MAG: 3D domain-containing protein [Candidatus Marithrix sp.]|nr:3D domain-containing protein [Candidatus Marithrix sp.]